MVHLLPHERFDRYTEAVRRITAMADCLKDHSLCKTFKDACENLAVSGCQTQHNQVNQEVPTASDNVPNTVNEQESGEEDLTCHEATANQDDAEEHVEGAEVVKPKRIKRKKDDIMKCPWLKNHESKLTLHKDKIIMGLAVKDKFGVPAAGLQVLTRRTYKDILVNNKVDVEDKSDKELLALARDISRRLEDDVFGEEGKVVIQRTRTILDLPSLAIKIKKSTSTIRVALTEFGPWIEAVRNIPVTELEDISEEEMKAEFKLFINRLDEITKKYSAKELEKFDTKLLIKTFFEESNNLYQGIEMVLQAMAVSSVKSSCESILESFVSQYENHFDQRRNVDETTATEEFEISCNGPSLAQADAVITEAMDLYWDGKPWHFFRTSPLEKLMNPAGISSTIKRVENMKNKLPFMS